MTITETDKAYLAGLIDGEGCITINECNSPRTPTPIMSLGVIVVSTERDFLDYYQQQTGLGYVGISGRGGGNWRPSFRWAITSIQAVELLQLVYPYLKIKKEQADIAFRFQETMNKSYGGKGENCVKGGKRVNPDILLQRQRYKQALTQLKGFKAKRGRPKDATP